MNASCSVLNVVQPLNYIKLSYWQTVTTRQWYIFKTIFVELSATRL